MGGRGEVLPDPQTPTFSNSVHDCDREGADFRITASARRPPAYRQLAPDAEISNPPRFPKMLKEELPTREGYCAIPAQSCCSFTSPSPGQFPLDRSTSG